MADPFAAFEGRYGRQSGGGGDVWSSFENRFSIARLDPSKSKKAGGLNMLDEKQLATLGYKPGDIEDWNENPIRKQKRLEDVLTGIASQSSPTLKPGYQPGSLTKTFPRTNVEDKDLSTWRGFASGAKQTTLGAMEEFLKSSGALGITQGTGEITEQDIARDPEKYRNYGRTGNSKYFAPKAKSTAQQAAEALNSGAFYGTMFGKGLAQLGGTPLTKFGLGVAEEGSQNVISGATQRYGKTGSTAEAFNPEAMGQDLTLGAIFGGIMRAPGAISGTRQANKALSNTLDQIETQNTYRGVADVINQANISQAAKKQMKSKLDEFDLPTIQNKPQVSYEQKAIEEARSFVEDKLAREMRNYQKQTGGVAKLAREADVGGGMEYSRQSMNPQWYRKFYEDYGRAPTKADYLDMAKSELNRGSSDARAMIGDDAVDAYLKSFEPKQAATPARSIGDDFVATPGGTAARPQRPTPEPIVPTAGRFDVQEYAQGMQKEIKQAQPTIAKQAQEAVKSKGGRAFIDDVGIFGKIIKKVEKEQGITLKPGENVDFKIDRVRRASLIADQMADDTGLKKIIQDYGDSKTWAEANAYLRDKRALELYQARGENVAGIDLAKAARNVQENAGKFQDLELRFREYNKQYLDKAEQYGLISPELKEYLLENYQDYAPLARVIDEVTGGAGSSPVSLSKQTVIQALKGSEKTIRNPLESSYENLHRMVQQGERNQAAKTLASYVDLEGNPFNLRELAPDEAVGNKSTFSFLDNGKKRIFETSPEIAEAAKNMNPTELGLLGKIFAVPNRVLKAGATALNPVFALRNIPKDQSFAFIMSKHPILGVKNFFRAIADVSTNSEFTEMLARAGAGGIEADALRNIGKTVNKVRADRSLGSKVGFTIKHPSQMLRSVEDLVGKTEQLTRTQYARATYQAAKKAGTPEEEALALAAREYNKVSVDFLRAGTVSRQLNAAIPFFNPSIQGTRTFLKGMKERPVATTAKLMTTVYIPSAALVAYNLSDPDRQAVWKDIPDWEKENNIILILPGAKKGSNGKYEGVIKMPVNPAFAAVNNAITKQIEGTGNLVTDTAKALAETVQPFSTDPMKFASQITPQAIKPFVEHFANKDLFTGAPIIPKYIDGKDTSKMTPSEQVKADTSGTARGLASIFGISPIRVEKLFSQLGAGVGKNVLNASDNVLAAMGVIPKEQIGGQSVSEGLAGALTQATGGKREQVLYEIINSPQLQSNRGRTVDELQSLADQGRIDEAQRRARQYNSDMEKMLETFNKDYKADSKLEEAIAKVKINEEYKSLKARKSKKK